MWHFSCMVVVIMKLRLVHMTVSIVLTLDLLRYRLMQPKFNVSAINNWYVQPVIATSIIFFRNIQLPN